jgi:hypothetical protein
MIGKRAAPRTVIKIKRSVIESWSLCGTNSRSSCGTDGVGALDADGRSMSSTACARILDRLSIAASAKVSAFQIWRRLHLPHEGFWADAALTSPHAVALPPIRFR